MVSGIMDNIIILSPPIVISLCLATSSVGDGVMQNLL